MIVTVMMPTKTARSFAFRTFLNIIISGREETVTVPGNAEIEARLKRGNPLSNTSNCKK